MPPPPSVTRSSTASPAVVAIAGLEGAGPTVRTEIALDATTGGRAFLWTRLAHRERATVEFEAAHLGDRRLGGLGRIVSQEGKAARPGRVAVRRDENVGDRTEGFEGRTQVGFSDVVGQVRNI